MLYGNLVSSPHVLRNLQGRRGVYFMYPDVGVRQRGRFQLESEWTNECEFDYELQDRSHSSASRPDGALPHYPRPTLVSLSLHRHAGE